MRQVFHINFVKYELIFLIYCHDYLLFYYFEVCHLSELAFVSMVNGCVGPKMIFGEFETF